ncbi:hypothetical protein EMPG_17681 [Blastomyces silverae]|uniref:Uncharacterized protein n=1 Tax=Blastomyces silverae TaxID=2060906 RepID=A0A0H1B5Y5_9EURO|nr:hypothetical protein EMPG_17681 [Blastomyces silverae]
MAANVCCAHKEIPATRRVNPPQPPPVPQDGDEHPEAMMMKQDGRETQLEGRVLQSTTPRPLTSQPNPIPPFQLVQCVVIRGMQEPLEIKQRDYHTGRFIHFPLVQMEARQVAEAYLMKQNGKRIEPAGCVAMVSTKNPISMVKVTIEEKMVWKEITRLLGEYFKEGRGDVNVEVTTYFHLVDLSSRPSHTSAEYPRSCGFDTTGGFPQTLRPKRPLEVKNGPDPSSSPQRPAKCPRILEAAADGERSATTAAQNQRSIEPDSWRIEREIITRWRCQERNCHNYKDCCWVALDNSHIRLRITEIESWIHDIERGDATAMNPSRELTKRLLSRGEKEEGKTMPATLSTPVLQAPHTPAVIALPPAAAAAATASAGSNTATSSDIFNVMMTKYMEAIGALSTNDNQQSNFSSSNLYNPASPPNASSSSSAPTSILSTPITPIPESEFGAYADLFIDEFFAWVIPQRPRRSEALLAAKQILQNEGYELDIIPRIPHEQVVRLDIGMGIFCIIRDGLRNPDWHARLKHIKSALKNTGKKSSTARETASSPSHPPVPAVHERL